MSAVIVDFDVAALLARLAVAPRRITATTSRGLEAGAKPTNDDTYLLP